MAVRLLGLHRKSQSSKFPLPMERASNLNRNDNDHVIDITSSSGASPSSPSQYRTPNGQQQIDNMLLTSTWIPDYQPAFSAPRVGSNIRNSSLNRRESGRSRNRSPLNSGLWISVELVLTLSQIIAAIVVLAISRHEHPHTPLVVWVVGYASGCAAILPLLYWRYHHRHRNQGSERESSLSHPTTSQNDLSAAPSSGTLDRDSRQPSGDSQGALSVGATSAR